MSLLAQGVKMSEINPNIIKILAVEDDAGDFGLIQIYLGLAGFGKAENSGTLSWASSLAEARKIALRNKPDIVLLDLNLPDSAGLETIVKMRSVLPGVPIVVMSGNDDKVLAVSALNEGVQDYLVKGQYEHDALGKAVRHALVRSRLETRLRLFEVALNTSASAIVITDPDAIIQWANPAFTTLTGYHVDEALGHKPGELVRSGLQSTAFYKAMWDTIGAGGSWQGELINRRKDGELYHELLAISPVVDHQWKVTNYVAIKTDITERIHAKHALEESQQRMELALAGGDLGLWDWSVPNGKLVFNPRACAILGYQLNEVENGLGIWKKLTHPDDWHNVEAARQAHLQGDTTQYEAEYRMRHKEGRWIWVLDRGKVMERSQEGLPLRVVGTYSDITERHRMEEQVRQLAFYDPLTKLANRRLFNDRLKFLMASSRRSAIFGAVLFLDLDNFKPLNDTHGHDVGDLLLIEVAQRIVNCVRETDTVARFGGDEFVVLLSELSLDRQLSSTQAAQITHKILRAIAAPYELSRANESSDVAPIVHHCTASIGVTLFLDHLHLADEVLKAADAAMYQAKSEGRNRIVFATESTES